MKEKEINTILIGKLEHYSTQLVRWHGICIRSISIFFYILF